MVMLKPKKTKPKTPQNLNFVLSDMQGLLQGELKEDSSIAVFTIQWSFML